MSVFESIRALARGQRPHNGNLLGTCLLSVSGAEIVGEEDIVEYFRSVPLHLADDAFRLETQMHFAVFDSDEAGAPVALVADLYNGRVGRLWRLGPAGDTASGTVPERRVDVPFDPDLQQSRGDVLFRAADHAELDTAAAVHVEAAAAALARDWQPGETPAHRTRSFVVRAFSSGNRAVALIALYRATGGSVRHIGFDDAALHLSFTADANPSVHTLVDARYATLDGWSPRL